MFPIDFHVSNQHPINMSQQLTQNSRVKKFKMDCAYANYVGGTHFFESHYWGKCSEKLFQRKHYGVLISGNDDFVGAQTRLLRVFILNEYFYIHHRH